VNADSLPAQSHCRLLLCRRAVRIQPKKLSLVIVVVEPDAVVIPSQGEKIADAAAQFRPTKASSSTKSVADRRIFISG
jgi:hypothetical protein